MVTLPLGIAFGLPLVIQGQLIGPHERPNLGLLFFPDRTALSAAVFVQLIEFLASFVVDAIQFCNLVVVETEPLLLVGDDPAAGLFGVDLGLLACRRSLGGRTNSQAITYYPDQGTTSKNQQ